MIVISDNTKISEDDEKEKSNKFKEDLAKFFSDHGKENFKCPIISGRELDLYKLFQEVMSRGGFKVVSETKQWKDVVSTLDLPPSCTSASFTIKNHYSRYLLAYETSYTKTSLPNSSSAPTNAQFNSKGVSYQPSQRGATNNQILNQPTPQQEQKYLGRKIVRPDQELNYFFRNPLGKPPITKEKNFIKPVRVLSAILDMKRVELAFESHLTTEIYWAINTLLIFSSNLTIQIHIENQPYLMESMTNFIYYCVNNISDLCFIIDVIDDKRVEEHERIKEKWSWMKKSSTGGLSSQSSTTSLYGKDKKYPLSQSSMLSFSQTNTRYRNLSRGALGVTQQGYTGQTTSNFSAPCLVKGNFQFMDETSHTLSLPTLYKKGKDLRELDKIKGDAAFFENPENTIVGTKYEEMTEYELYEILISMIQIMRNLSFINSNEASIFKSSKFMKILYLLFIHSNLNDIVSNALDIITNLSKHILLKECPYPSLLMWKLFKCLTNLNRDMSEQALECFRRLILLNGNEEFFEQMPDEFLTEIVSLLISPKADIRDSALEILYCLSDQKIQTKTRLGKTEKCIQRLVGLICSNSPDNRMPKFAACVLSKLAEIPQILKMIMPYEQELFVAASTDDSITKVILGIISN